MKATHKMSSDGVYKTDLELRSVPMLGKSSESGGGSSSSSSSSSDNSSRTSGRHSILGAGIEGSRLRT